jgi:hypothetical protein
MRRRQHRAGWLRATKAPHQFGQDSDGLGYSGNETRSAHQIAGTQERVAHDPRAAAPAGQRRRKITRTRSSSANSFVCRQLDRLAVLRRSPCGQHLVRRFRIAGRRFALRRHSGESAVLSVLLCSLGLLSSTPLFAQRVERRGLVSVVARRLRQAIGHELDPTNNGSARTSPNQGVRGRKLAQCPHAGTPDACAFGDSRRGSDHVLHLAAHARGHRDGLRRRC